MNEAMTALAPLPYGVWRTLHAVLMDDPVPRRQAIAAIAAFEQALKAATTHEEPVAPMPDAAPPPGQEPAP